MPAHDDPTSWSESPPSSARAEQVSHGTWRLPLWAWQVLFLVIAIGGAAVLTRDNPEEKHAGSASDRLTAGGQSQRVEAVAFSADGRSLASCGWDNAVRIWDIGQLADDPAVEPTVLLHDSAQLAIAFSPDSATLAAGGEGSLTIWAREGKGYKVVFAHGGMTYRCLAFSPDGRTLALGGDDNKVRLWDIASRRERAILVGHVDVVRSLAFSPDGRRLISTGQDRHVLLWDAIRGEAIRSLAEPGINPVQFGAFSPDGVTIAVGESSGNPQDITLFDAETGLPRNRLSGHLSGVNALAFSPDGLTLASAGTDRSIKLWDVATGKEKARCLIDVGSVKSIAFSPDGARLAFGGEDSSVQIWELKCRQAFRIGAPRDRASRSETAAA